MNIAQLTISRLNEPLQGPGARDFNKAVEAVNKAEEKSSGFVWRYKNGDGSDRIGVPELDDPFLVTDMTVWESVDALKNFVSDAAHTKVLDKRDEWFDTSQSARFVMWWIEAGREPKIAEGMARLAHLQRHGDSERAFGWDYAEQAAAE